MEKVKTAVNLVVFIALILGSMATTPKEFTVDTVALKKEPAGFTEKVGLTLAIWTCRKQVHDYGVITWAEVTDLTGETMEFIGLPFVGKFYRVK